jgi:hypothetical protein
VTTVDDVLVALVGGLFVLAIALLRVQIKMRERIARLEGIVNHQRPG